MQRRVFQFAIVLLWLALPLVALDYRQAWDQLPSLMATHFNAANQANGWMSRESSFSFSLWMMAIALAVSTVLLIVATWRKVDVFSWALLGFFALVIASLVSVNQAILSYNLHGTPVHPEQIMIVLPLATLALIAAYLASHRQAPLPSGETLAVESHEGGALGLIFAVPLVVILYVAAKVPVPAARLGMALVGLVIAGAAMMAWSGFQYRFLQHGVEVRTMGFRLRSIPKQQILSYDAESWSPVGGYGIRGIGGSRAYVWGNKVVHIKTTTGDVYLGHRDPERIIRDLDMVTGRRGQSSVTGQEGLARS